MYIPITVKGEKQGRIGDGGRRSRIRREEKDRERRRRKRERELGP